MSPLLAALLSSLQGTDCSISLAETDELYGPVPLRASRPKLTVFLARSITQTIRSEFSDSTLLVIAHRL